MKYVFVEESWEDYLYWQKTDKKKLKKINELLKDISRKPFDGIGISLSLSLSLYQYQKSKKSSHF
mgnify:CR=1 FL=1